jgi:hypothetical protein
VYYLISISESSIYKLNFFVCVGLEFKLSAMYLQNRCSTV